MERNRTQNRLAVVSQTQTSEIWKLKEKIHLWKTERSVSFLYVPSLLFWFERERWLVFESEASTAWTAASPGRRRWVHTSPRRATAQQQPPCRYQRSTVVLYVLLAPPLPVTCRGRNTSSSYITVLMLVEFLKCGASTAEYFSDDPLMKDDGAAALIGHRHAAAGHVLLDCRFFLQNF